MSDYPVAGWFSAKMASLDNRILDEPRLRARDHLVVVTKGFAHPNVLDEEIHLLNTLRFNNQMVKYLDLIYERAFEEGFEAAYACAREELTNPGGMT